MSEYINVLQAGMEYQYKNEALKEMLFDFDLPIEARLGDWIANSIAATNDIDAMKLPSNEIIRAAVFMLIDGAMTLRMAGEIITPEQIERARAIMIYKIYMWAGVHPDQTTSLYTAGAWLERTVTGHTIQ